MDERERGLNMHMKSMYRLADEILAKDSAVEDTQTARPRDYMSTGKQV